MGGGNLQMEQLHALFDVHLLAPAKTMTARERLDAEFVEAEATQVASTVLRKPTSGSIADAPLDSDSAASSRRMNKVRNRLRLTRSSRKAFGRSADDRLV